MNMLVMSMKAEPACVPYTPGPATDMSQAGLSLQRQAYMDDLALVARDSKAAQVQLTLANTFLTSYGMAFNRLKCHHTSINAADTRAQLNLGASGGQPLAVPSTEPDGTFEYLGHHLNTAGTWAAQEAKVGSKLAAAMRQVTLASGHKACHTLWTAMLTDHDACTVLPYYMSATGFSAPFHTKARTAAVEAVRSRAFIGKHVARINLCGPTDRKGMGITDPVALDAAVKVSTLFRLLTTDEPRAVAALAGSCWEDLHTKSRHPAARIPALHRGAARGLLVRPRGEPALHIVRASRDLPATSMTDLVPPLRTNKCKAYAVLSAMPAGEALSMAATRTTAAFQHSTGLTHELSYAEEDILLTGGQHIQALLRDLLRPPASAQHLGDPLAQLLSPAGLLAVATLRGKGRATSPRPSQKDLSSS
jgi:hypothetical protein